jgi:hypothetical protein
VNSFMTEAGLTLAWAWCDKWRGKALLVGAPFGRGAMSTLKAEVGTWAWFRVCRTERGNVDCAVLCARAGQSKAVLSAKAVQTAKAAWAKVNKNGRWARERVIERV